MAVEISNISSAEPRFISKAKYMRVWIVVGLWTFLVVQFAVDTVSTLVSSEPFPTITMPAFSAERIDRDGTARITTRTIAVIGSDGSVHQVEAADLLSPLYSVPAGLTLDRLLKPTQGVAPGLSDEALNWLRNRTEQLAVTDQPVGLRVEWLPGILDLRSSKTTVAADPSIREVRW
ncbi:hypothetical protein ASE48_25535 [Mycobacterium sp. Root265]|uniref:hypothetical protein n=1 Tax=Mycobacterium sp. Root265 TaxID=1736504 RepID=UPI00070FD130|nr:hypothetical protein [Mycobacterium sp. Root265]KRD17844.1 hypothetical protein ASE48_25535 [Mycobacterium sp. Root265]